MSESNGVCGTAVRRGSIILLARIVDSDGTNIGRANVAAIDYSIYEVDPHHPGELTAVAGHETVPLEVRDVIFDSLITDYLWTVDDVGYNFRHEIALGENVVSPQADTHIDIRYVLTPTTGAKTSVRFQLEVI